MIFLFWVFDVDIEVYVDIIIVIVLKVVFFYFIRFVLNNIVVNFLMYLFGVLRLVNLIFCEN